MSRFINTEVEIDLEDYRDEIFNYFKNQGIEGNLYDKLKEYLKEMKKQCLLWKRKRRIQKNL